MRFFTPVVSVLFLAMVVGSMAGSIYALYTVFGVWALGLWTLGFATQFIAAWQADEWGVSPWHLMRGKIAAVNFGVNAGCSVALILAVWALIGGWIFAALAATIGISVAFHAVTSPDHSTSYGATMRWA